MNPKTILSLLLLNCFLTPNVSAQKGYSISLDLTGFEEGTWFRLVDLDLGKARDSVQLTNGKGVFKGYVNEPVTCRIHTVENKYLVIELDNSELKVKGNYQNFQYASITGSELNRTWTKSRDFQKGLQAKRDSLMQVLIRVMETNPQQGKEPATQLKRTDREIRQYRLSFIKTEKPSYFTLKELFFLRNDLPADSLRVLFALFPTALQKTKYGEVIAVFLDTEKMPVIGDRFIDIEGADVQGNHRKLSDHKGKYVLLEFWASWCGPCVKEIPNLARSYEIFKNRGLEIYSFSIDADGESWKKALKKYQTPWINVVGDKGSYSLMAARYGVRAIPKNYLISPEGTIVAIDLRGDGLYEKLKELIR